LGDRDRAGERQHQERRRARAEQTYERHRIPLR
jgi:hypothetical protein